MGELDHSSSSWIPDHHLLFNWLERQLQHPKAATSTAVEAVEVSSSKYGAVMWQVTGPPSLDPWDYIKFH